MINRNVPSESRMSGTLHHPPPQHAGQAQRLRPPLSRPTLGLRHAFGLPPPPHMAHHSRHAHQPQTPGRVTTAGAQTGLLRLPVGRRKAHTTARGGAQPAQGALGDAPGGLPQGCAPVTPPGAPRVVTDHGEGTGPVALWRAWQGRGGPWPVLHGRQGRGAGGASRRGGLWPTVARGHDAGPRRRAPSAPHPSTVKAAGEKPELPPPTHRDQTGQAGASHGSPGLLGPPAAQRQGRAAPPQRGRGGSRGATVGRATLGWAAAARVVMDLLARPMGGGPRAHSHGPLASTWPHALGHQLGQEGMAMACEGLPVPALARQGAQHGRARRRTCTLVTGLRDREPGGGSTDQAPPQVPAFTHPGPLQGQGGERVAGERVHVLARQGLRRIGRQRGAPMGLRALASSSRYRRVLCFF